MKNLILMLGLMILLSTYGFGQGNGKPAIYSTKEGAIKGYDPVAYFEESKPVKGKKDIVYSWMDADWHFANMANKEAFALDPEKYAPAFGGWCAFGWAKGYPAKIEVDAWSIVDEKLYLNYNSKIQQKWVSNQEEFIKQAQENYNSAHSMN